MITFERFTPEDGIPIFRQIITHIKRGIAAGEINDGDALPSRRVLSALLGINPNTIQKAYRILEEEGLISSHAGAKSCIVLDEARIERVRGELLLGQTRAAVRALRAMGVSLDEAAALLRQCWEEPIESWEGESE